MVALLLACSAEGSDTPSDASSSTSATDTTSVDEPPTISPDDFEPCGASLNDGCVEGEDHCICGPQCAEYGPAGAPGRCLPGAFFTLCTQTYVCVIPCSEDTDCPDPNMVCRACPEDIEDACSSLGNYAAPELNGGPMMCSYPAD